MHYCSSNASIFAAAAASAGLVQHNKGSKRRSRAGRSAPGAAAGRRPKGQRRKQRAAVGGILQRRLVSCIASKRKQQQLHAQQQRLAAKRTCSSREGESPRRGKQQRGSTSNGPKGEADAQSVGAEVRSERAALRQRAQRVFKQRRACAARTFDLPRKRRSSLTAVRLAEAGRFLAFFFLPSRTSH